METIFPIRILCQTSLYSRITGLCRGGFFGGVGTQTGIAWDTGNVILGLYHAGNDKEFPKPDIKLGMPINAMPRLIGVVANPNVDEFYTLKLGRHRSTEDWIEEAYAN